MYIQSYLWEPDTRTKCQKLRSFSYSPYLCLGFVLFFVNPHLRIFSRLFFEREQKERHQFPNGVGKEPITQIYALDQNLTLNPLVHRSMLTIKHTNQGYLCILYMELTCIIVIWKSTDLSSGLNPPCTTERHAMLTQPEFRSLGNVLNAKKTNAQLFWQTGSISATALFEWLASQLEAGSIAELTRGCRSDAAPPTPKSGSENL